MSIPDYAYSYATEVLKGENVPDEILKSIASDADLAYKYANKVLKWQNVPDDMLRGIASNARYSYNYANEVLKGENVPDEILKSIMSSAGYAYKYANEVLKGENVPDEILKSIASDVGYSYNYATEVLKGENVPDEMLKIIASDTYYYSRKYSEYLYIKGDIMKILKLCKTFENPTSIPTYMIDYLKNPAIAFKFITDVLIPKGITMDKLFELNNNNTDFANYYGKFSDIAFSIIENEEYAKYIAKKYFNWTDVPKIFRKSLTYKGSNMYKTGVPNTVTFTESFEFTETYNLLLDSFTPEPYDMDRIYELFNQEYMQSTGKSWTKDKFLNRAKDWEFWGDENGFVSTRKQQSGFIKLVGAAGSNKSKYKGFKELINANIPVWGLVDITISNLLKKLNYRGPNMIERMVLDQLLKSGKMQSVLGDGKIEKMEGDKLTLTYPDVGTVEKYFMGSPEYWKLIKTSLLKKGLTSESSKFEDAYSAILEKFTKKKKKKVSPLRSKCQSKAKAKYDVWPSAYASGYVQKCVKRKGKMN